MNDALAEIFPWGEEEREGSHLVKGGELLLFAFNKESMNPGQGCIIRKAD